MDKLFHELQQRLPGWADQPVVVSPMMGGITNQNFKVMVGKEAFVVRICAQNVAIHGIDRQVEQTCNQAAAAIGVAPAFIAFFDDLPAHQEVLVTRFVEGRTLAADDVRSQSRLQRVAHLMRKYHALPRFAGRFDVFHIFEQGLTFCKAHNSPLPAWIDDVAAHMARIKTTLDHHPPPLAACHNDLLPANLVEAADGRLWLVDWEYAGWGDPFFDLGNLAVNNDFTDAEDEALLMAYQAKVTSWAWARLKLMKIVSDAREGIWAMVQTRLSSLEFDFADYGTRHLERFMVHSAAAEVKTWLRNAAQRP
jgi:thiamine kinase-like enzyme